MSGGIAYVYDPDRTFDRAREPRDGRRRAPRRGRLPTSSSRSSAPTAPRRARAVAEAILGDWDGDLGQHREGHAPRLPPGARGHAARRGRGPLGRRGGHGGRPMGKPTGFMEFGRELPRRRPVPVRLRDWREVYEPFDNEATRHQGARCMDCGIPFCHEGCPLGNLIPEWNDLVYRDDWSAAIERLHATNNFPEFTGRLCPAPCEAACVLGINADPVTIERIEYEIAERAWGEGWVTPPGAPRAHRQAGGGRRLGAGRPRLRPAAGPGRPRASSSSSGPRSRAACSATASPSSRWRRRVLDRRLAQLVAEGVEFRCATAVGRGARRARRAARARRGAAPRRRLLAGGPGGLGLRAARGLRRHGARRRGHGAPRPRRCPAATSRASTSPWST